MYIKYFVYMFDHVFHIIRAMEVLFFSLWFSEVYIHTCYIDHTHEYALNDTSHRSLVYVLFNRIAEY